MKTQATPVLPQDRVVVIDTLRGIALFGILVVNMQFFAQPMISVMLGFQPTDYFLDTASTFLIKLLFEGKFYVLFSALFGYGFAVFLSKSLPEGQTILPVFRRRLAILLLIGIMHLVFLWSGDILIYYSIFGFILILFRNISDKALVRWTVWLVLFPLLLTTLVVILASIAMSVPEAATAMAASLEAAAGESRKMIANALHIYATGTFREMVAMRLREYQTLAPGVLLYYPVVMAMFLMGFMAGRKRLLENFMQHLPLFRKALWIGAVVGLPFSLLYAFSFLQANPHQMNIFLLLSTIGHSVGGIFLSLFYVSGILLLAGKNKLDWFSKLIAPVGRMALTNYLLQSLLATFIFYGYGLGFIGMTTSTQGLAIALIIFSLQIPISHVWLRYFHYGPFEWIWRSLTYIKFHPFRRGL